MNGAGSGTGTPASHQRRWLAVAVAAGVLGVAAAGLVLRSRHGGPSPQLAAKARRAGQAFLDAYVDADGRVARRDQGGDTVSEGQAYALLIAAALGDQARFAAVWRWTQAHLQRPDGLLSSRWVGGAVQDPQPAADADLDATRALLVAADRFGDNGYRAQALRIAAAIQAQETRPQPGGALLLAGPWATEGIAYVNPSYLAPATFELLAAATHSSSWRDMASAATTVLKPLLANGPGLPPDWAQVHGAGLQASPAPGGGPGPQYGFDAVRTFVRLAEDCNPAGRSLAASAWPFFRRLPPGGIQAVYDLAGRPVVQYQHPAALVGAAGSAQAAGDPSAASGLLDQADVLQVKAPTYYGGAWAALGRILLTTPWLRVEACG